MILTIVFFCRVGVVTKPESLICRLYYLTACVADDDLELLGVGRSLDDLITEQGRVSDNYDLKVRFLGESPYHVG